MRRRAICASALIAAGALVSGWMVPAGLGAQPSPPPPSSPPANQLASVTLARGVNKGLSLFGADPVTPVDPTTSFISTDVPYAIVKFKTLQPNTDATLRVVDPSDGGFAIDVGKILHDKEPRRDKPWDAFDFALPVYILGTDMEGHTGGWHFQVSLGGQTLKDVAFEWQPATPLALSRIRDAVDQDPTIADLHWRYGAALAQFNHDREALDELQAAVRLDSHYALYEITLGRIYEREGRKADAIRAFQTALSIHGSSYDAIFSAWARAHLARLQAHH